MYTEDERRQIIRDQAKAFFDKVDMERYYVLNRRLYQLRVDINSLSDFLDTAEFAARPPLVNRCVEKELAELNKRYKKTVKQYQEESSRLNERCRQSIAVLATHCGLRVFYSRSAKRIISSAKYNQVSHMIILSRQMAELRREVSQ